MPSITSSSWPLGLEWLGGFVRHLENMCYRLLAGSVAIRLDSDSRGNIKILFVARRPIAPLYFDLSYNREEQYWAPRIEMAVRETISNYTPRTTATEVRMGYRPRLTAFDELTNADMQQLAIGMQQDIERLLMRNLSHMWYGSPKESKRECEANTKAEKLLLEKLSHTQKLDWKANKYFLVKGNITGISYKLKLARTYNIEAFLFGKRIGMFCITTKDSSIPIYDLLLAQKLLIETDEKAFIEKANPEQ
ncbi:MAG: hypothetical protein ACYC1K_03430 [Minisyncoccota bacterium]